MAQDDDGKWVPAYAVRRPDFKPGQVLSLRHGARSDRAITPVAQRVAQLLASIAPALAAYPMQIDLCSRTYAPLLLIDAYLDEVGVLDESGVPRERLLKQRSALVREVRAQLREMGLTRKAAAELQLDVAAAAQAAVGAARQAETASSAVQAFLRGAGVLGEPDAADEDDGDD